MPYDGKEFYHLEKSALPPNKPSQPADILKQLDRCVDEAVKAESTGDWTAAEAERHLLDAQISGLDICDGVRVVAQVTMGIRNVVSRNWPGVICAFASLASIVITFIKRHRSSP